ncbi:hypothetical protein [Rhodococcus sp. NPDC055024]
MLPEHMISGASVVEAEGGVELSDQQTYTVKAKYIRKDGVGRRLLVSLPGATEVWGRITRIKSNPERPNIFDVTYETSDAPTNFLILNDDEEVTLLG